MNTLIQENFKDCEGPDALLVAYSDSRKLEASNNTDMLIGHSQ